MHRGCLGPGLSSCLDQNGRASGAAIDTSTAGLHAFAVTATSGDGQHATATVSYTVAAPKTGVVAPSSAHGSAGGLKFALTAPGACLAPGGTLSVTAARSGSGNAFRVEPPRAVQPVAEGPARRQPQAHARDPAALDREGEARPQTGYQVTPAHLHFAVC
jgi:hypothetical protein